jgi:hypothetical protein
MDSLYYCCITDAAAAVLMLLLLMYLNEVLIHCMYVWQEKESSQEMKKRICNAMQYLYANAMQCNAIFG